MFIVISASAKLSETSFFIRRCLEFKVRQSSRSNQRFIDASYMASDGTFRPYDKTYDDRKFKNKRAAINAFRKYYPKEKFFLIEHLDDPK